MSVRGFDYEYEGVWDDCECALMCVPSPDDFGVATFSLQPYDDEASCHAVEHNVDCKYSHLHPLPWTGRSALRKLLPE